MSDEMPDPLAEFDQTLRGMADMAKATRAYYLGLVAAGFTAPEALQLTVAWQLAVMRSGQSS